MALVIFKMNLIISLKKYINEKYLEKNKSSVLKFIFKLLTVKPSNLSKYENEELNIIMSAKKLMDLEKIDGSLIKILKLDKDKKYFVKWIRTGRNFY